MITLLFHHYYVSATCLSDDEFFGCCFQFASLSRHGGPKEIDACGERSSRCVADVPLFGEIRLRCLGFVAPDTASVSIKYFDGGLRCRLIASLGDAQNEGRGGLDGVFRDVDVEGIL